MEAEGTAVDVRRGRVFLHCRHTSFSLGKNVLSIAAVPIKHPRHHEGHEGEGNPALVYEPTLENEELFGSEATHDLESFKRRADVIVANRWSDEQADVGEKVYTRDLFRRDWLLSANCDSFRPFVVAFRLNSSGPMRNEGSRRDLPSRRRRRRAG